MSVWKLGRMKGVFLLVVMAWLALPRGFFHACEHVADRTATHGLPAFKHDSHCPICEQVLPHFVAPAPLVNGEPVIHVSLVEAALPKFAPQAFSEARTARGPPQLG